METAKCDQTCPFNLVVNTRVVLNGNVRRVRKRIIFQKLFFNSEAKNKYDSHLREGERKKALSFGGRIKTTDVTTRLETVKIRG